jgi:TetR/AcrR family transcriptional regulator
MANVEMTRKEREKLMHKEAILRASVCLFSKKGFHNVSMQDIADESEFAVGTLYNFFPSKEQLFAELLNNCANKIYQTLWPILESNLQEDEKLRTLTHSYCKLVEDNVEIIRLYISEYGTLTLILPHNSQADKIKVTIDTKIGETIKSGIKNKIFQPVDVEIVTMAFVSTIRSFIFESSRDFNKARVEQGLKKIEDLFIDKLLMPAKQIIGDF